TLCDAQMEVFKKGQQGFLYTHPENKSEKTPQQIKLINMCKISNSPGGCFEYFMKMKKLLVDVRAVPDECLDTLSGVTAYKKALWDTVLLLAQLAWGEKPPETYYEKFNWLTPADLSLFCDLKRTLQLSYGTSAWNSFQEEIMRNYPGASALDRKSIWEKSILSVNCSQYL
ncbi:MAG: hypothetical protein KDD34_02340, partial [Bdellovibrionales bacterium]|nr:hypothetical protein [Bdellovibrionales bacterium]